MHYEVDIDPSFFFPKDCNNNIICTKIKGEKILYLRKKFERGVED